MGDEDAEVGSSSNSLDAKWVGDDTGGNRWEVKRNWKPKGTAIRSC